MQITNYDVLVEASNEDGNFRLANEHHVGNKRFEVFLNLHKESYQDAKKRGDNTACENIVSKILDIVCHKCIPNGRFLERVTEFADGEGGGVEGEDQWMELGEGQLARAKIHQALNMGNATHRSSKVFTNTQAEKPKRREDDALKRRRRGSYARLRRSISESMLFHTSQQEQQKSKQQQQKQPKHESNRSNTTAAAAAAAAADDDDDEVDVKPMDVVVASNRKGLASSAKNPGNARFNIMIQIHADRYVNANEDERKTILEDLVNTVQKHWNGRFLVRTLLGYEVLNQSEASKALNFALSNKQSTAAPAAAASPPAAAAPVVPVHVPSLAQATFGADAFNGPADRPSPSQMSPFTSPLVPTPTAAKAPAPSLFGRAFGSSSTGASANFPNSQEIQSLRSAAVQGLKARKQKRAIMNRIGKGGKGGKNDSGMGGQLSNGIFLMACSVAVLGAVAK